MNLFFSLQDIKQIDKRYLKYVVFLFSFAIAYLYYSPFLHNFFVLDDFKCLENPLHGFSAVIFGNNSLRFIPNTLWWPLYQISGIDPFLYNLLSTVLHFINSIMLYFFVLKLFNDEHLSLLASIIFISSGVAADAVLWKSTNSTLLCLFFYLWSLHSYVKYRKNESKTIIAPIILFVFAMLSKEEAASLPFIIILLEILFFDSFRNMKSLIKILIPFYVIIIIYMSGTWLLNNYLNLNIHLGHGDKIKFSILYSLFGGLTVFFLPPDGILKANNLLLYTSIIVIPLSFIFVKKRNTLIFAYAWIVITFLPQSLIPGHFSSIYDFNYGSISRYLYLPVAGFSILFSRIMLDLKEFCPRTTQLALTILLILFIAINYKNVHDRGNGWQREGQRIESYLHAVKEQIPVFPTKSDVLSVNGYPGKGFIQSALRAYYDDPNIYYIKDSIKHKEGHSLFVIYYDIVPGKLVDVKKIK